mmetsp:Transcript_23734/g.67040  ORF Transcript_23734/g.67040 Transcript_23734/m.67040 type:complete len:1255 (+) Transcript_23734:421-4185(+)|eukprot:CAMPEP_0119557110 /NCGR_PEP_ID=MMETSP1352-20130426/8878_1 /TAXON_ID=265584 /ORGANISM="Stauroneis constricta, Strain CCMP1120" /LENGTH=1254 /DNA_ID=CAMNT_0007604161 /DNA_START=365 /DNA_END=4129 /DNA_ORIENTATION=+
MGPKHPRKNTSKGGGKTTGNDDDDDTSYSTSASASSSSSRKLGSNDKKPTKGKANSYSNKSLKQTQRAATLPAAATSSTDGQKEDDNGMDAEYTRKAIQRQNRLLNVIKAFNGEAVERYAQNKWKDVSPLKHIFENHEDDRSDVGASPYQPGYCAELEEEPFVKLQRLLRPKQAEQNLGFRWSRSRRRLEPSQEAIDIFGQVFAQSMVTAAHQVDLSGIVWGSQWTEGVIRGVDCGGYIEPQILLLCLASERFYRSEPQHLQEIVKSLDGMDLLEQAIIHWGWEDDFYHLAHPPKYEDVLPNGSAHSAPVSKNELRFMNDVRSRERARFMLCILFCTRVYVCEKYFGPPSRGAALKQKLRDCLHLMTETMHRKFPHLQETSDSSHHGHKDGGSFSSLGELKRRKRKKPLKYADSDGEDDDEELLDSSEDEQDMIEISSSDTATPAKKKCKQEPAHAAEEDDEYIYIDDDDEDSDNDESAPAGSSVGTAELRTRGYKLSRKQQHDNRRSSVISGSSSRKRSQQELGSDFEHDADDDDDSSTSSGEDGTYLKDLKHTDQSHVSGSHGIVSIDASSMAKASGYESSSLSCDGFELARASGAKQPVQLVCPNTGQVVANFSSMEVVKTVLALQKGNSLHNALNGKLPQWRGYHWQYVDLSSTDRLLAGLKFNGSGNDTSGDERSSSHKRKSKRRSSKSKKSPGITIIEEDEVNDAGASAAATDKNSTPPITEGETEDNIDDAKVLSPDGKMADDDDGTPKEEEIVKNVTNDGVIDATKKVDDESTKTESVKDKQSSAVVEKDQLASQEGKVGADKPNIQDGDKEAVQDAAAQEPKVTMDTVTCPYTERHCLEDGEEPFETMQKFLQPTQQHDGDDKASPISEAVNTFGATLAKSLVKANKQVAASQFVYDAEWRNGTIEGVCCGFIPKAMLLLCLQSQEFAKEQTYEVGTLSRIISDLGVSQMVRSAISEWKIEGKYRSLKTASGTFSYDSNFADCTRCELFVARVYRVIKALRRDSITRSLMNKVKRCLEIMESNIRPKAAIPVSLVPSPLPMAASSSLQPARESGQAPPRIHFKEELWADYGNKSQAAAAAAAAPRDDEGEDKNEATKGGTSGKPVSTSMLPPKTVSTERLQGSKHINKKDSASSSKPKSVPIKSAAGTTDAKKKLKHNCAGQVEQVDIDTGRVIAVFRSANMACIGTTGTAGHSMLYRILRQAGGIWKGYSWRFSSKHHPKVNFDKRGKLKAAFLRASYGSEEDG